MTEYKIYGEDLEPNEEEKERVKQLFTRKTRGIAKIILLSHTGSRAFGWSTRMHDLDIHGYFYAEDFFDYVHSGDDAFDLNMYDLKHLITMELPYKYGHNLMNMGNPFYIDKDFPYNELLDLITQDFFTLDEPVEELQRFRKYKSPRTALHGYRACLVPIYFLEKRRFLLNIFKINAELDLKLQGIYTCRDIYAGGLHRNLTEDEVKLIESEIEQMIELLKETKEKYANITFDKIKYNEFVKKLKETYGITGI